MLHVTKTDFEIDIRFQAGWLHAESPHWFHIPFQEYGLNLIRIVWYLNFVQSISPLLWDRYLQIQAFCGHMATVVSSDSFVSHLGVWNWIEHDVILQVRDVFVHRKQFYGTYKLNDDGWWYNGGAAFFSLWARVPAGVIYPLVFTVSYRNMRPRDNASEVVNIADSRKQSTAETT